MPFVTTQNPDGTITVAGVPIFPTCERGEDEYTEDWIEAAFKRMVEAESEGHLAPVHIHHTGMGKKPEGAGFMRPDRIDQLRWRGKDRTCIYVDLILTSEEAVDRLQKKQLPYRSVELDFEDQEIVSLALLDTDAPFVEMPMTFLTDIEPESVTDGTNSTVTFNRVREAASPVLCFARFDKRTTVLMEAEMPDDEKELEDKMKAKDEERDEDEKMQDEDAEVPEKDESEDGDDVVEEIPEFDIVGVCEKISTGDIPLAAFAALREAMDAAEAMVGTEEEEALAVDPQAPAQPSDNPPDVTQMERRARDSAENFKLSNRVAVLEAEREKDGAISDALNSLGNVAFSGDPRSRLVKEYDEGAKESGHAGGMTQLRYFVKYASEGGYPTGPGKLDTDPAPISGLPEDAAKILNGDPNHDEGVARAYAAYAPHQTRFSRLDFPTYWAANKAHYLTSAVTAATRGA